MSCNCRPRLCPVCGGRTDHALHVTGHYTHPNCDPTEQGGPQ